MERASIARHMGEAMLTEAQKREIVKKANEQSICAYGNAGEKRALVGINGAVWLTEQACAEKCATMIAQAMNNLNVSWQRDIEQVRKEEREKVAQKIYDSLEGMGVDWVQRMVRARFLRPAESVGGRENAEKVSPPVQLHPRAESGSPPAPAKKEKKV